MIYLSKSDLISSAFERFIDESSLDDPSVLDNIELQNIELVRAYIASRYNVSQIFSEANPIRNSILIRILVKLVLHDLIRRNAARKVPTDILDGYENAIATIEKVSTGRITLEGVPSATDENGSPNSNSIWGNNSNKNFYI